MKTAELIEEIEELRMFGNAYVIRSRLLQQVEHGDVRTTRTYIYGVIDALEMCNASPVMITQLYNILNRL